MVNLKKIREVSLVDEVSSTVSYIGTARIPSGMSLSKAMTLPMWQIIKIAKPANISYQYYPLDNDALLSPDRIFIWDDRTSLTYDS